MLNVNRMLLCIKPSLSASFLEILINFSQLHFMRLSIFDDTTNWRRGWDPNPRTDTVRGFVGSDNYFFWFKNKITSKEIIKNDISR